MTRRTIIRCVRLDPNDIPKIVECTDPRGIIGDAVSSRPFNETGTQQVLFHTNFAKKKLEPTIVHPIDRDELCGTIVIAGRDSDGDLCSLTETEANAVRSRLKKRAITMQIRYSR